jgi:hypothetical protein
MNKINKRSVLAVVATIVLIGVGIIALLLEGYFWTERSKIKGRVIQLTNADGEKMDSWALENQPFSWDLTVKLQDLPSELKQDGITIECDVVSMDTSEGNPGIDGYAVVNGCERK